MKNISKLFLALFTLVMASCSVEDVQDRPVIEATDAPVITAPLTGASYIVTPSNAENLFERFAWKPANFAGDVVVTYNVEIAKLADKDFTKPQLVQSSNSNNVAVTGTTLNKAAIDLGLTPFVGSNVWARVTAVVGTQKISSEPIEIVITPFKVAPLLGVVGNHQGWDLAKLTAPYQLKPSAKGNSDFVGYVYLDGGFKLLEATDDLVFSWDNVAYGSGGAGVLDPKGGDLNEQAGYYYIKADTQKLTYSTTKTDWGIIGSATPQGWNASTPMTFDKATNLWTVTVVLDASGKFKFRANDAWTLNYGDDGANGVLEEGGANIAVAASGTYKVTLDLSKSRAYTYTLEKL
jgi:hypothetical protein